LDIITIRVVLNGQETSYVKDSLTEHELDNFPFDITIVNNGRFWKELEDEIMKKLAYWL